VQQHKIAMLGTGLIGDFYSNALHAQRSRDRVRVVYWDTNGFAMWSKRLESGRYSASHPAPTAEGMTTIGAAELALVLEGIVCQALLPKADGKGRVCSLEIMVPTPANISGCSWVMRRSASNAPGVRRVISAMGSPPASSALASGTALFGSSILMTGMMRQRRSASVIMDCCTFISSSFSSQDKGRASTLSMHLGSRLIADLADRTD
jgi:hypothetical protein